MTREGTGVASDTTPRSVIDLNRMLRSVVRQREDRRNTADFAFTLDLAENPPKVCVDPQEIERVLATLVVNAEQAVRGNAGRLGQIQVKTFRNGERVQVMVTDNGRGIPSCEMARLFGDQSKDVSLTVCAEIVKDHGGELYAWSSYGNGSIFTLELPTYVEIGQQEGWDETLGANGLQGKRILVIDDEIHISTLMSDVLERHGAEIDLVNSGVQAVEQIKSRQYDLLICDQRMPDLSGEGFYRSLESNPELRSRFLFVTGDALNDDSEEFFTETGVPYIQKPFRAVELLAAIEQVLSRNRRLDF